MKTQLGLNEIHHLDCFELLSKLEDSTVDLAVIDPPYNLNKADWDTFESDTDFFDFTFSWIDALIPKLKQNGSLYIFNTPYNSAFILQHLVSRGLFFRIGLHGTSATGWAALDDDLAMDRRPYFS